MEFFLHASCRALLLTDKIMTQEENLKQLLFKDLCARLPYGVICSSVFGNSKVTSIDTEDNTIYLFDYSEWAYNVKPYLRPMSSMTEEEKKEWHYLYLPLPHKNETSETERRIDWLNAHHFDYRGLIEKGLALEAKEGMYKIE